MVGIMGVDQDGYVQWVNSVANSLLKIPFECSSTKIKVDEIFDLKFTDLLGMIGKDAVLQRLVNGFSVYMCADLCDSLASKNHSTKDLRSKIVGPRMLLMIHQMCLFYVERFSITRVVVS
jgi:hypothetical protein